MATSATPVFSLMVSTAFQFLPPSVVLYKPRSPPGPHKIDYYGNLVADANSFLS